MEGRSGAECWVRVDLLDEVERPLSRASDRAGGGTFSASSVLRGKVLEVKREGREGSFRSPPLAWRGRGACASRFSGVERPSDE
jgi:hypothetical protein